MQKFGFVCEDIVCLHQSVLEEYTSGLRMLINAVTCKVTVVECKDAFLHHLCKQLLFLLKISLISKQDIQKTKKQTEKNLIN